MSIDCWAASFSQLWEKGKILNVEEEFSRIGQIGAPTVGAGVRGRRLQVRKFTVSHRVESQSACIDL